jgi:hypothetical protein
LIGLALVLAASAAEHRYALVVGHDQGDFDEQALRFAQRDARRVAEVLTTMGGVPSRNLVLLEAPDAGQVRGALDRLDKELSELPEDDQVVVFVFYSGHADASALHLGGSRLALKQLEASVQALPADARVLLLDACRTGELTRRKGATVVQPFEIVVESPSDAQGMAIITSAAAGEDAQESDRLAGGVFTHHLVTGMRGAADASGEGQVTLTEAYRYAFDRTVATTSSAPTLQHPSFKFDLSGSSELVLTRTQDAASLGRLRAETPGHYLLFDEAGRELVAEFEVPTGGTIAVKPGVYLVRRRSASRLDEARVEAVAGQVVALSGLKPVPLGQATRRGGAPEHTALALQVGGGWVGPMLEGQSSGPSLSAGLRVETSWVSVLARGRTQHSSMTNEQLTQDQLLVGGELALVRYLDLGRFSLGPQLSGGADRVWQTYETTGLARDGQSWVGRVGPAARLEWSPLARVNVALEGGLDVVLANVADPSEPGAAELGTSVVPRAMVDVGVWLR